MSKGKSGDVIVNEGGNLWMFWCPGCACAHGIDTSPGGWEFDGNAARPTIKPSILVLGPKRCHSFVTDGMIEFLVDTEGMMANKTMELPEWPFLRKKDF